MITDTEHAKEMLTQVRDSVQPRAVWWRERNAIYYNKACLPDRLREMIEDMHLPKEERIAKIKQRQLQQNQQVRRQLDARNTKVSRDALNPKQHPSEPQKEAHIPEKSIPFTSDFKPPERFDIYHHPVIRPVLLRAIEENGFTTEGKHKIPFILPLGSRQCPFVTDDWSSSIKVDICSISPESISDLKK
jgi:hypothetical protein